MPVDVNTLGLPTVDVRFIPSERDTYEQVAHARSVFENNWIATTIFGFAMFSHEDVNAILKDKRWHNAMSLLVDSNSHTSQEYKTERKKSLILLENEDHSRIKKLVQPAFSSSNINKLRPYMRQYMNLLIDQVIDSGSCDIQKDIFDKYPANMICNILGVPDEDWSLFNHWAKDVFTNFEPVENPSIAVKADEAFSEYIDNLLQYKKENLSNDLLSDLIRAEELGSKLTIDELKAIIKTIIVAGIDTTKSQLGITFIMLMQHLDLWNSLNSDHNITSKIIDESLRIDSVLKNLGRYASEDIVYKDILFPKGTVVYLFNAVSNYDQSVFQNPDDFDYERNNLSHHSLSFGAGIHHCLGMALAKAELQEAFDVLYQRLPSINISGDVVYKKTTETVWGAVSIPTLF